MRKNCQQFANGIHANRDPLDERASRGEAVFEFTYQKVVSQWWRSEADQFYQANSLNLGECNIGDSFC